MIDGTTNSGILTKGLLGLLCESQPVCFTLNPTHMSAERRIPHQVHSKSMYAERAIPEHDGVGNAVPNMLAYTNFGNSLDSPDKATDRALQLALGAPVSLS